MDKTKYHGLSSVYGISWEDREFIVKDYLSGQESKQSIWEKYTGSYEEKGRILIWLRKLGYKDKPRHQVVSRPHHRMKKNKVIKKHLATPKRAPLSDADAAARIAELERQLEEASLLAEGYKLMVHFAEKEHGISIEKKSGTK